MKILMLTPYLPYPPSSGGQVRSYNLLKYLCKKHKITLFALVKNNGERQYISELEKYCRVEAFGRPDRPWTIKNVFKTGLSSYPFVVIRNFSVELKEAIIKELSQNKYDLIHAETFYVMPHIPQTRIPVILVDQTIEYQVYQHVVKTTKKFWFKPLMYIDVKKIKYWETKFWQQADLAIAVSEEDKKKMQQLVPGLEVEVVPNGAGEDLINVWNHRTPLKKPIIFFQASFNWMQNIEAAENLVRYVFPQIKRQFTDAECWVVGQMAKEKVNHLNGDGVKVIDLANNDIQGVINAYKRATVFVAPLEGPGGTRLKVLAAMAAGVPVVITRVGIEGIDAVDGRDVLIADRWDSMAKKVIEVINDSPLCYKLITNARKLVEEKYSYVSIADKLDHIYRSVAKKND